VGIALRMDQSAPGSTRAIMGSLTMHKVVLTSAAIGAAILFGGQAVAQGALPYGETVNLEQATKAATAAQAEAAKNGWAMATSVVGPTGDLVYFQKMDNTHYASVAIAQHKARAAATFRRPTKAFQDRVAQGGAGITAMTLDGMIASAGGLLLVAGGKIIGAIGCSGGTGTQDAQTCQAGADALK
jgi:uncharacterized protein GlcG (DUF336 family)